MWLFFWPENAFSPFSYTGGLLVCKNEKLNCFDIQCVVEASSFGLNHNMTLESKENYPRYTKTVQNSLGFMPEVKPLHKPRGDLVLSARSVCLLCPTLNGLDLMDSDFLSFCIGQCLPTLVYCIDTSVAPTNIHNAQSYGESLASTDQCTVMMSECTISLTNIRFCSHLKIKWYYIKFKSCFFKLKGPMKNNI